MNMNSREVQRQRQALASEQKAWDQTMSKEETMVNRVMVHYLPNGENTACGALFMGEHQATTFLSDATCKKCIKVAKESNEESMSTKTVTLYTLAPASLDRAGTESVGSYWLYREPSGVQITGEALSTYDDIPGKALREVIMPESKHIAQHQAYVNHRTFTEVGLNKALARGEVYRPDEQVKEESDYVKLAREIMHPTTEKEGQTMPRKKAASKTPQVPAMERLAQELLDMPAVPAVSALDAILAQPIVDMAAMVQAGQEAMVEKMAQATQEKEDKALARSLSMQPVGTMPLDLKALAQEIIAALKAEGLVMAQPGIMPLGAAQSAVVPLSAQEDSMASIMAAMNDKPVVPAKPKSTLRLFTKPKTAEKTVRASGGKTDPAIVKAIQHAWRSGKVTQAELALKYDMDDKKVWYFCNRAKQL